MLRSMYSGISGMKNFQTKLDVIGNNIANVNTYGFKKGRVTFKDAISQSISGASAPTTGLGGKNPTQVGLGSTLGSIDTVDTQASMQTTGRPLDLAIDGDGYFAVKNGNETYYTRAGNFYLDSQGNLVNSDGYFVQQSGGGNIQIPSDTYSSFDINSSGVVTGVGADGKSVPIGTISIVKFNNPAGLTKVGGNLFKDNQNSGTPQDGVANNGGRGSVNAGYLEMSNVDLSEEFTEMIVAQRGFQANTRIITTSDEILQELINLKH
ncbi:flagellar basal body rod protein FlgG [Heyndrickxia camelliae]|uniref:Flagellar basal-body rod protein FlgF n=1 Tax=Heyndrickxia camelliae TaxID=1707093 RepID=A0A2N3LR90_9BACI|nr:flagellar basal body rod protein FlgG [Heyndrickxia camelliae]PKR87064.1 flagellar basal-body rod protein FlgF [Heyndrickxia camelliae]